MLPGHKTCYDVYILQLTLCQLKTQIKTNKQINKNPNQKPNKEATAGKKIISKM